MGSDQHFRPLALAIVLALTAPAAHAQTPEQWVQWGERVHGGFGSLIALGIRVGLDAPAAVSSSSTTPTDRRPHVHAP